MAMLEAGRSIVVVIDLQGKLVDMVERSALVVASTIRLMKIAALFEVPVILTEQYPKGLGPTKPEVRAAFDSLPTAKRMMEKTSFGCCGDPGFGRILAELRPELQLKDQQLVIAGIEAHVCVMQTTLELLRQGAGVYLCWECVSGRGEEYRRQALHRMTQSGAVLTNHESVGFEWARSKDHPRFKDLSNLLKEGQLA
jgi:nicotinamidase-related amidase